MIDYTYRYATPDDDPALLELFKASWNGREFSPDYWRWFAHECPDGPVRTTIAVAPDGSFAGSYTLWPQRLWLNGRIVNASAAVMVNTHPDHQGRGVFVAEGEWATGHEYLHDTPLSIAMPNSKAWPGHQKVGYEQAFPLVFRVKYRPKARRHYCLGVNWFGPDSDAFMMRNLPRYNFAVVKSSHWLNWRIVKRRDIDYSLWEYRDDGVMGGYVILKHFDDPTGCRKSHIVDIQAATNHAYRQLLACAETFAAGRDELSLYSNPRDPWRAVLGSAGYVVREAFDRVILHTNYGERLWPEQGAWSFNLVDNDVY